MPDLLIYGVTCALVLVLFAIFFAFRLYRQQHLLQSQLSQLIRRTDKLEHNFLLCDEGVHEVRTGAQGVANKVKDMGARVNILFDKIQELENLDPDTRMYNQAARLVDAGATVEELMQECDLPRAEAELLMSLKKRNT